MCIFSSVGISFCSDYCAWCRFTKTYRINEIIQSSAKFKRVAISATDVMKPMFVLLALNIIVLAVWSAIDPLERKLVVVSQDPFLRNTETYSVCQSDHDGIFLGVLCGINVGSLLLAMFQAFKARHINTELQESYYIFMAIVLVTQVMFLGIPVVYIAQDNVSAYYFVSSGIIFVICVSVLLLIFLPKVYALRKTHSRNGETRSYSASNASTDSVTEGIQILSTPRAVAEQEKEIRELKRLLALEREVRDNDRKIITSSSVRFADIENSNSSDASEEGIAERCEIVSK